MNKIKKILVWLSVLSIVLVIGYQFFITSLKVAPPEVGVAKWSSKDRVTLFDSVHQLGVNHLLKNKYGLWEMYLEGDAYSVGLAHGVLAKELVQYQEDVFVYQIKKLVPSPFYRSLIHKVVAFFNKELYNHIPEENLIEIYGVSLSASEEYDEIIGPKYNRIVNYHAAHDVGHALNDYSMVGCSSFAQWDSAHYFHGRNFDFYVGDEFAGNKILTFIKPDKGIPFAFVNWGGFTGVVSGMNLSGLSLTINAAKSDIPTTTKCPISIVARNILQYASTIEEADSIANLFEVFVSESIFISSAKDNKSIIIEKSPEKQSVFYPENGELICTNHFQSEAFKDDVRNLDNIKESSSFPRYKHFKELIDKEEVNSAIAVSQILRDRTGEGGENIGNGNELALNQLIAHHSIIFEPREKKLWLSTSPYQLGEYVCYDLNEVFSIEKPLSKSMSIDSLVIDKDAFVVSEEYHDFETYKSISKSVTEFMWGRQTEVPNIDLMVKSNPEYFYAYELAGDVTAKLDEEEKAKGYYILALEKVISNHNERVRIEEKLIELNR